MIRIYVICSNRTTEYDSDPLYTYVYSKNAMDLIREILEDAGGNFGDDDVVGFMYDDRFLVRNEQPLIAPYIERILEKYDVILPYEAVSVKEHKRIFPPGAVIARRTLLKEFAGGGLPDDTVICDMKDVAVSFRAWIRDGGYRVKTESMSKADPEKWNAGYERIDLLKQYTDTLLAEYINLRSQAGFEDSFAEDDPYQGDFGGKIPVWICWWQGIDAAPEVVCACVQSIKRNLPQKTMPVFITSDNWHEYVTFTGTVLDKFERKLISYTHLADILRCELLYRYGGLWIDSTYFVSGPLPDDIFRQEFYSLAFDHPLWGMDIMRGRWSSSLLGTSEKHSCVMQFMMEGLWLYWEQMDEAIDYFFWDYILDAGYRHIAAIRHKVDGIVTNPPAVYDLQLMMDQRISAEDAGRLCTDSLLYKLNRRNDYHRKTRHGFTTYYGYICGDAVDNSHNVKIRCNDEAGLIHAVRECNPSRIIDADGYFEDHDWVSRGMIDDVILHELTISRADVEYDRADATAYIEIGDEYVLLCY